MISRWMFLRGVALALVAVPCTAEAQQRPAVRRIGVLTPSVDRTPAAPFFEQLRELGWVEGQNLVVERRSADGRNERLPSLAAELTRLNVEVIVPGGPFALRAARDATTTIPIVMAASTTDPVGEGFIRSYARPGGNITGVALQEGVPGKRLQLLKEAVPKLRRVGSLAEVPLRPTGLKLEEAGRVLGVEVIRLVARTPADFEGAMSAAMKARVDGMMVAGTPMLRTNRRQLADLLARHRLPAIGGWGSFADDGFLMAYAPSFADQFRLAAVYVDKILKGAKPADLPVEQPTRFELVINVKTAKALGLAIPPALLLQADRVIE